MMMDQLFKDFTLLSSSSCCSASLTFPSDLSWEGSSVKLLYFNTFWPFDFYTGSSSSSSSSSKKQMAGAKKIRGTNNLPAILFHSFHGENVRVSPNGQNARRVDSFCRGIAFSNRPVKVTEKIYIKFTDISSNWSGALRFGFTSHDPASYAKNGGLPKYVCPDLTNRPGHWAKALGERLAQTDSILCYYVTSDGSVHYSINGEDKGVFFSGVQTSSNQLWALIDIYGNTTGIEFVDPRAQISNQRNQRTEALSITSSDPQPNCSQLEEETYVPLPPVFPLRTLPKDHEASLYSSSPSSCTSSSSTPGLTPLCFHKTRGCNIRLSNDRSVNFFSKSYLLSIDISCHVLK